MKLIAAKVTNYKNIIDSGWITLDDVTCLVGKNQSGKSALLQALYRLNPVEPSLYALNHEVDYPKARATEYSKGLERDEPKHDVVVAGRFSLDEDDIAAITSKLGKVDFDSGLPELIVRVNYIGKRVWSGIALDDYAILRHLLEKSSASEQTKQFAFGFDSIQTLSQHTEQSDFTEIGDDIQREIVEFCDQHRYVIDRGPTLFVINKILSQRLPKFIYYDAYSQMPDRIGIDEFIGKVNSEQLDSQDLPMLGMLKIGGLEPNDLVDAGWSHERLLTEL